MLEKKPKEKNNWSQTLATFIPVWVQIISCLGLVLVTFVSSPLWIERFFPLTATAAPATVLPVTDAPLPTPVALPDSTTVPPPPQPGQDWNDGCVNSVVWKTYLAGESRFEEAQCYQLSKWGITAAQGRLTFAAAHSQSTAYEYGILTPYNNWNEVDFSVEVDRHENSEIWVGFFEGDTPRSTGIVFVIQPGDVVDIREMPYETEIVNNINLHSAEGKFHTRVIFEGGKIAVWVDGQGITSKLPVNFTIKNMFIGYRALPNTNLNVEVFDLKLKP